MDTGIIICGCARNVGSFLPGFIINVNRIIKLFKKYTIVIAENDSTDNTRQLLSEWKDPYLKIINLDGLASSVPDRALRISHCRNAILRYIKSISNIADYKYTLILDIDICWNSNFSIDGFKTNFETDDWVGITANNKGKYYDIWALRNNECKYDCWDIINRYSSQITRDNAKVLYVGKYQKDLSSEKSLIPVISAFNGAAIYKTEFYIKSVYLSNYRGDKCEHVPLNKWLAKYGKIFINPKFIVCDEVKEHIVNVKYTPITENDCYYVSSRGILKSCEIRNSIIRSGFNQLDIDHNTITNNSVVYISTSAIPSFFHNILPYLSKQSIKIILVTGDSDDTTETFKEAKYIAESENIIAWFSQNCLTLHKKIIHIPIGMDYHTMVTRDIWGPCINSIAQEFELFNIIKNSKHFYERKAKIYGSFHFALNRGDRKEAFKYIPSGLIDYEPKFINRNVMFKTMINYAFVASPYGAGPDCHRTWEALILGCIPIIKTSNLDLLFKDLPVLIIMEWKDINKELLENTLNHFKGKHLRKEFNYQKLSLKYWTDLIYSHRINN